MNIRHVDPVAPPRRRKRVAIKRVYDKADANDGVRVLVDRLWPRGVSKARAAADYWLKDAGPSDELRQWFGHDPRRWKMFSRKYRAELAQRDAVLDQLVELRRRGPLTLLFAARDTEHNNAVVLRDLLEENQVKVPRSHH
jgi:uncharacterized protein YeaO (DUF488 family)